MNERLAIGGGGGGVGPAQILELARALPGADGPLIADKASRQRLADWYVQAQGL